MRQEQIDLISDFLHYKLNPRLAELFPFELIKILGKDNNKNCILMETSHGKKYLWLYQGQEASLAYQLQLLQQCKFNNINGLLYPLRLRNDCTYSRLDDHNWFYVTDWKPFYKISYSNSTHLNGIIKMITAFRQSTTKIGMIYCLSEEKRISHNLLNKEEEINKTMEAYLMLAEHRLKPTKFDKMFIESYQKIYKTIQKAKYALENTNYLKYHNNLRTNNLIIYNLDRNNLRIDHNNTVYCLRLKNVHWDLPVIDLAILLSKSGRSNKWSNEWYNKTIDEYLRFYDCSDEEIDIVKAYIAFPWSVCRLISRYYYNRVEWSITKYIDKFDRLLQDEIIRNKFIEQI